MTVHGAMADALMATSSLSRVNREMTRKLQKVPNAPRQGRSKVRIGAKVPAFALKQNAKAKRKQGAVR